MAQAEGTSTWHSKCFVGTQQSSFFLGHWNDPLVPIALMKSQVHLTSPDFAPLCPQHTMLGHTQQQHTFMAHTA